MALSWPLWQRFFYGLGTLKSCDLTMQNLACCALWSALKIIGFDGCSIKVMLLLMWHDIAILYIQPFSLENRIKFFMLWKNCRDLGWLFGECWKDLWFMSDCLLIRRSVGWHLQFLHIKMERGPATILKLVVAVFRL